MRMYLYFEFYMPQSGSEVVGNPIYCWGGTNTCTNSAPPLYVRD